MANPQCENGYTKIANEILDAFSSNRIPGEQMQCLMVIIRRTYGFKLKESAISNTDFMNATGLKRPSICRALKALEQKNIISKSANSISNNANSNKVTYRFNKDYKAWKQLAKKLTVSKSANGCLQKSEQSLAKKLTRYSSKENLKKDIKKEGTFPVWLNPDLFQDFLEHRKKLRKPMTDKAKGLLIKKLDELRLKNNDPNTLLETAIERGWLTVYEPNNGSRSPLKPQTYAQAQDAEQRMLARMILDAEKSGSGLDLGETEYIPEPGAKKIN